MEMEHGILAVLIMAAATLNLMLTQKKQQADEMLSIMKEEVSPQSIKKRVQDKKEKTKRGIPYALIGGIIVVVLIAIFFPPEPGLINSEAVFMAILIWASSVYHGVALG